MEYRRLLRPVTRFWPLIAIGLILGATGGYHAYRQATPLYESTTQLVVGWTARSTPPGSGAAHVEGNQRIVATQRAGVLAKLASTQPAIDAVLTKVHHPGASVAVVAAADPTNSIITIVVISRSPELSAVVANGYQAVLIGVLSTLVGPLDTRATLKTVTPGALVDQAVQPNLRHDVGLGALAGLLLGLAVAVAADAFAAAPHSTDELAAETGLPALVTIPRHPARTRLPLFSAPRSPASEAYRLLRTHLLSSSPSPSIIALTSSDDGDGTTVVAANLATALRQAGRRVVVVDGDVRHARGGGVAAGGDVPGLVDVLAGTASIEEAIQHPAEHLPAAITAGRGLPESLDLLGSPALDDFFAGLRSRFDYVIVDMPPPSRTADAAIIAREVDAVILVSPLHGARPSRLRQTADDLRQTGADLLGVVGNDGRRWP